MDRFLARLMRRMLSFEGRLTRGGFWALALLLGGSFVVLFVFLESALGRGATWLLYPPFFWSAAALLVKRLHDRARSAWWFGQRSKRLHCDVEPRAPPSKGAHHTRSSLESIHLCGVEPGYH